MATDPMPNLQMTETELDAARLAEAREEALRFREFINGHVIPDLLDIANLAEAGQPVGAEVDALLTAARAALKLP